jgi:hypothetical protein
MALGTMASVRTGTQQNGICKNRHSAERHLQEQTLGRLAFVKTGTQQDGIQPNDTHDYGK